MTDAADVAYAKLASDLVIFDTAANRYAAVPGAFADADEGEDQLAPETSALLAEAGVSSADAHWLQVPQQIDLRVPDPAAQPARIRIRHWFAFLCATARAASMIARGQACHRFSRDRTALDAAPAGLAAELERLQWFGLWLPVSHRCLPASLRAACYLRDRGIDVDLVFGVRSHPFEAHCWLERAGMILNDDPDHVRAFTPIIVGRL